MSSKMRRTPLFGYDGNLGIPIIPSKPKASTSTTTTNTNSQNSANGKNSNTKYGSYSVHTDYSNSKVGFVLEVIYFGVIPLFYLLF